jgi:diketogulonate reductase-like aldo/keto reductase
MYQSVYTTTVKNVQKQGLFYFLQLPHIGNRASDVEKYLTTSLRRLQLDSVDLYLIHVPFGFIPDKNSENPAKEADGSYVLDNTDLLAVWKVTFHLIFQFQYISKPVKFAHYIKHLNSFKQ